LAGCRQALGDLFFALAPTLRTIAAGILKDLPSAKIDAADLVQESLMDACQGFHAFRGTTMAEFLTWLRTIQMNRAKTMRRKLTTLKRGAHREQEIGDLLLTARNDTPCTAAVRQEEVDRFLRCWESLGPDDQQVLHLRDRLGLSFEEVADRMGRTVAAVRRKYSRACERLRRIYESL
jgi:RNA polymerase sigma-70 factor (ECF subfamily)